MARARLRHLQSSLNEEQLHGEVGLKTGNMAWDEYVAELDEVYERNFVDRSTRFKKYFPFNNSASVVNTRK